MITVNLGLVMLLGALFGAASSVALMAVAWGALKNTVEGFKKSFEQNDKRNERIELKLEALDTKIDRIEIDVVRVTERASQTHGERGGGSRGGPLVIGPK